MRYRPRPPSFWDRVGILLAQVPVAFCVALLGALGLAVLGSFILLLCDTLRLAFR